MAGYEKKNLQGDGRGRPKKDKTKKQIKDEANELSKKEKLMTLVAPKKEVYMPAVPFDESIIKRAYKLCLLGLNNNEIAMALNISITTLSKWLVQYPALPEAMLQGREIASANVAQSLYKRAIGFSKEIEEARTVDHNVEIVRYKKYFPPSVPAATYWLNNRDKSRWGEVKKHEIEGTIQHMHGTIPVDLSDMSVEELKLAAKLGMKLVDQEKQLTTVVDENHIEAEFLPKKDYEDFNEDDDEEELSFDKKKITNFHEDTYLEDEDMDSIVSDEDENDDEE